MTDHKSAERERGCTCDEMRRQGYREVCPYCIATKDWSRGPTPVEQRTVSNPDARAAEIAGRLSKAQREAVLSMPSDGSYLDEYTKPPWPNIHMRAELDRLGEMRPNTRFRHAFRLTPLGLSVRRILESQ